MIFLGLGTDTSNLSLDRQSRCILNVAEGGAGGAGGNGGSGLGGGVYVLGGTTACDRPRIRSLPTPRWVASLATGGASGQGVGGGLYIDTGADVTLTTSSEVIFNFASTSADDIFGVYTIS